MKVSKVLSYIDLTAFLILDIDNLARFPLGEWCPVSHMGATHYVMKTNSLKYMHPDDKRKQPLADVGDCKEFIKQYVLPSKTESRYVIVNDNAGCLIHSSDPNIVPYED